MLSKEIRLFVVLPLCALMPALASQFIVSRPACAGDNSDLSPFSGHIKAEAAGDNSDTSHFSGHAKVEAAADKLASSKQLYLRALKEDSLKNYAGAVEYYTQAIDLNPKYGEAFGNRGAARFNLKDFNGSLSDYNQALKIFPNNKALVSLKEQVEDVLRESARANCQTGADRQAALANQMRAQSMLGGDFADSSTLITSHDERSTARPAPTGLAVDMSDPASIIMMNAKRRGLIPQNTPNP